jgi:hypothetical protein
MNVAALLAGGDVATQRRRAAALDGGHDFQLVEAQVTGVGPAPGRPPGAEDILDLQPFPGHEAAAL